MIRQIAPQFFTTDMAATLEYYKDKLGFDCVGSWNDPPVYAIVARDEHRIHFRLADPPKPNPDKYADELLDAYLFIEDADALYAEYVARGVEFGRALGDTPWHSREFVVKDCDGPDLPWSSPRLGAIVLPADAHLVVGEIDQPVVGDRHAMGVAAGYSITWVIRGEPNDPRLPADSLNAVLIVGAYHEMPEHAAILEHIRRHSGRRAG